MSDGVVTVNAERHQDVGGGVGDHALQEFDEFAEDFTVVPADSGAPNDVGQNLKEAHAEVGGGQMLDEEIHAWLMTLGKQKSAQHCGVSHYDADENDPQVRQLFSLVKNDGLGRGRDGHRAEDRGRTGLAGGR